MRSSLLAFRPKAGPAGLPSGYGAISGIPGAEVTIAAESRPDPAAVRAAVETAGYELAG